MGTAAVEQYDRRYSPTQTDLVACGGVEGSAFRILDTRIEIKRGFFGAAGVIDAIGAGQRIYILVVEIKIAGERAELRGFGNSTERIFRSDLRKLERGLHHAVEAFAGKIAGVGAGRALAVEDAHSDGS